MKINILNIIIIDKGEMVGVDSHIITLGDENASSEILEAEESFKEYIQGYMTESELSEVTDEMLDSFVEAGEWVGQEGATIYLVWSNDLEND